MRAAGGAAATEGTACAAGAAETLVHGDWHLGQLARLPGRDEWLLIDIDDLGTGCPASDLGRPAGFWAAGLLDDPAWSLFLAAYREGGGPGCPGSATHGRRWMRMPARRSPWRRPGR